MTTTTAATRVKTTATLLVIIIIIIATTSTTITNIIIFISIIIIDYESLYLLRVATNPIIDDRVRTVNERNVNVELFLFSTTTNSYVNILLQVRSK